MIKHGNVNTSINEVWLHIITYFPVFGKLPSTFNLTPNENKSERQKRGTNQNNRRVEINPKSNKKAPKKTKVIEDKIYNIMLDI